MTERLDLLVALPIRYVASPSTDKIPKQLIVQAGTPHERLFTFFDRIEIGRMHPGREGQPGQLLVEDPTISSRHCIITQTAEGRCFIRDVSRNGTRLGGRRLVPNQEVEIQIGQTLRIGANRDFQLAGESAVAESDSGFTPSSTLIVQGLSEVTVLVGDIKDYTVLVREAPSEALQRSVDRVFQSLETEVVALGGTVKEYQGDAIFAFWEKASGDDYAVRACRAALVLDALARKLAVDPSVWDVPGFPLGLDWALTTGKVVLNSFGGESPSGLSMIGEPVVLAFRLEKFANDETGPILVCPATQEAAANELEFRDLGEMHAKGFEKPDRVFALIGDR